jgi:hypothetical protein
MWESVGTVAPQGLGRARLELHWAAQIVSAAGATLLEPRPDASHTNLGWERGMLTGHPIARASGRRAALRFADLAIVVVEASGEEGRSLPLTGKTLDEGTAWLAHELGCKALARPVHDLPDHAVSGGAAFAGEDAPARVELARWMGDADDVLRAIARENEGASDVRCWPHHFDIATLLALGGDRTIGVGLSPGDGSYAEPYFYVTPWPYPKRGTTLPSLPFGQWHIEGWTGAVLVGSSLARVAPEEQERAASDMLRAAIHGSMALHGEA